jgi:hypothetical protein
MGLDLRLPIGLMFSLLGVLLTVYGLFLRARLPSSSKKYD